MHRPDPLLRLKGNYSAESWTVAHALAAADVTLRHLRSLGLRVSRDNRLSRARTLILHQGPLVAGSDNPSSERARVAWAHRTVMEQYLIGLAVGRADETLSERLRWLLKGTDVPAPGIDGRPWNVQFELFVTAVLALGGVPHIQLAEPDIRISIGRNGIGIAAKRLGTNLRTMRERVREAIGQIRRNAPPGLVVLNLDQYAESRPLASAAEDCAALMREYRDLVAAEANDVVGGLVGFATLFHWSSGDPARFLGVEVLCITELLGNRGEPVGSVGATLRVFGRNVISRLEHAVHSLDRAAMDYLADEALAGSHEHKQRKEV